MMQREFSEIQSIRDGHRTRQNDPPCQSGAKCLPNPDRTGDELAPRETLDACTRVYRNAYGEIQFRGHARQCRAKVAVRLSCSPYELAG